MREVVAPHIRREDERHDLVLIEIGDGSAELYLSDDSMMATHVSGRDPWDVLVQGAKSAGWVIMPVGCPTCLTNDDQAEHLPPELQEEVALVLTGADLLRVIESA